MLPVIITSIHFPKTMYWTGKGGARFIRPIRWIVALLGRSGCSIRDRRRQVGQHHTVDIAFWVSKEPIAVTVETYEEKLRENCRAG